MNRLLYILFKIARRIKAGQHQLATRLRLSYYMHLSKHRFFLSPSILIGKSFSINSDLTATEISISNGVRVRDNFHIRMGNNGHLVIGKNCFFNNNCSISCLGEIVIGDDCQFGENVTIYDHNHKYKDTEKLIAGQGYEIGNISIGNNCWIGSNVVILKGVEIGDNVVIGAGCVIYKSISSNSTVINHQNLVITPGS
ncbi:MAG: acyltransferase [Ferruginibacter sp.]